MKAFWTRLNSWSSTGSPDNHRTWESSTTLAAKAAWPARRVSRVLELALAAKIADDVRFDVGGRLIGPRAPV